MMKTRTLLLSVLFTFFSLSQAHSYTVGGATSSITPNSGLWAWDNAYLADFRGALENPNFFGPGGVVEESITTTTLNTVDATTLATVDMFIAPWVGDSDAPAFADAVTNFFLGGGDLFLLQDDADHDFLGTELEISTTASNGSVSNGGEPFFDGPFGTANNVTQHYLTGHLDPLAISNTNGNIVGTNEIGQVTSAYWAEGEYAAGAGALFIIADVDMIATTGANGAHYGLTIGDLDDNAVYALNTFSFLKDGDPIPSTVPEPTTMLLFGTGLAGLAAVGRRRKK